MHKILLVEDSKPISALLSKKITKNLSMSVDTVSSFEEAKEVLKRDRDYFLALLDIHLPDKDCSFDGTVMINYMLKMGIPPIVMMDSFDEKLYQSFKKLNIVDFVLKESPESLDYIASLVNRVYENSKTKVLVIDDCVTDKNQLRYFLKSQLFNVVSTKDPLDGLKIVEKNRDIKIVIVDYHLPNLNGVELLKIIRERLSKNKIAVVGISGDQSSSIYFLKYGANDFVKKPFAKEEFVCRINNTAESLENLQKLEMVANMDFLTKIANRKYFFEKAKSYFDEACRDGQPCAVAMVDIDNFKFINDTYGHAIGDEVIKKLAKILSDNIKGQDIVARFGGEEFVLYLKNILPDAAATLLESLCKKISQTAIRVEDGKEIYFTVSIGLSTRFHSTLYKKLNCADKLLYDAKDSGKNRVVDDIIIEKV